MTVIEAAASMAATAAERFSALDMNLLLLVLKTSG
jgi:hypothetical protein